MAPSNRAGNPLSVDSLTSTMAASLPKDGASPLKTPYEAVALAIHAAMTAVDFKLRGLGEDHSIDTTSGSQEVLPLPAEWNSSSSYAFRYSHPQSAMEYLVKINRLGGKAAIQGIGLGDDKIASFDVTVKDFISESSLSSSLSTSETRSSEDWKRIIQDIFISPGRLGDLGSLLQTSIIQKLAPGIHKAGYEESRETPTERARDNHPESRPRDYDPLRDDREPHPARPYPFEDPLAAPPRPPFPAGDFLPPGFEDEHEINRPPRGSLGQGNFPRIGDRDLYPPGLGPNDPMRPYLGPGGGGMHPTFDDLAGRRGQDSYDPQVPPGSRYDHVGPGMGPRGGPGGIGGQPPNPFGGFGSRDFM